MRGAPSCQPCSIAIAKRRAVWHRKFLDPVLSTKPMNHRPHTAAVSPEASHSSSGATPQCRRRQRAHPTRPRHWCCWTKHLAPLRAFHETDHAIEESLAGVCGNADFEYGGRDARATGDGAEITAALADDGSGFARDRGFIHDRRSFPAEPPPRAYFAGAGVVSSGVVGLAGALPPRSTTTRALR